MPYHGAEEMALRGRQIVSEAVKTISHNNMGNIDGYQARDETNQVNSEYADFPQLFASYGQTNPTNCQAAIDELFSVADNIDPTSSIKLDSGPSSKADDGPLLSPLPKHTGGWTDSLPIAERTKDIDTHLLEWHGDARHQFDTFFVNHINTAFPLQAALARSLALILQAHQEIRARANADVWDIGGKAIQALQLQRAMCNCNPSLLTATITVGTAAASVLTAGGAMAAAMAAFSLTNAIANAGITASKDDKAKITGSTALDVLANTRAAIVKVEQAINNQVNSLTRLTGTLAGNLKSVGDRIEIPSPDAAPGFKAAIRNPNNPGGFYPTSL